MSLRQSSRPVRRPEYWLGLGSLVFVAVCFYGVRAALVIGLAGVTATLTDFICLFLRGRPYRLVDLSNLGNAIVLALLFPATVPFSIVIVSTVMAVAVGTHIFGYRKDLVFPPAAVGYLFALICWQDSVLLFPGPGKELELFHGEPVRYLSLTNQFNEKGSFALLHTDFLEACIGAVPGAMGTGCILLLALGIVILVCRSQLNFWAVLGAAGFILFPSLAGGMDSGIWLTNMLLFSVLFFLADPAVMPCKGIMALAASYLTTMLSGYLIVKYHIEYAPVAAVILTCPIWRGLAHAEIRLFMAMRGTEPEEEAANGE